MWFNGAASREEQRGQIAPRPQGPGSQAVQAVAVSQGWHSGPLFFCSLHSQRASFSLLFQGLWNLSGPWVRVSVIRSAHIGSVKLFHCRKNLRLHFYGKKNVLKHRHADIKTHSRGRHWVSTVMGHMGHFHDWHPRPPITHVIDEVVSGKDQPLGALRWRDDSVDFRLDSLL